MFEMPKGRTCTQPDVHPVRGYGLRLVHLLRISLPQRT